MIVLLIALVAIAVLVIWAATTYNSLVGTRNRAEEALGALDAHLKQRYDLIPNLVETVKGYAAHEEETLSRVIGARNAAMSSSPAQRGRAEDALSDTLHHLFALSESYPDLKANASFMDLQQRLAALETDILNARKYYNALARTFHFARLSYIEVAQEEKAVPEVRF